MQDGCCTVLPIWFDLEVTGSLFAPVPLAYVGGLACWIWQPEHSLHDLSVLKRHSTFSLRTANLTWLSGQSRDRLHR